jgi:hypothetical protein
MRKVRLLTCFLIVALALSGGLSHLLDIKIPQTLPSTVNAYKMFEQWGALSNTSDSEEYNAEAYTMDYVDISSYYLNNPESLDPYYWSTYDNYWNLEDGTVRSSVQAYLNMARTTNDIEFVSLFWVGDFKAVHTSDPWHYGLITMDENTNTNNVSDSEIFSWGGGGQNLNYFSFIWTCVNGGLMWNESGLHHDVPAVIGSWTPYNTSQPMPTFIPNNPNTEYGVLSNTEVCGVPFGFTGIQHWYDLSESNRCYIGFLDHSPWLKDIPPNWDVSNPVKKFPVDFYKYLCGQTTGYHQEIIESLNYASEHYFGPGTTWASNDNNLQTGWWEMMTDQEGMGFTNGWYFHQMKVWGDASMILPYGDVRWP